MAEGQGATTVEDRWIDQLQAELRRKYMSIPGGVGFIPASYASGTTSPNKFPGWVYSNASPPNLPHGLGYKARRLNAGDTATITKKCSSFKLMVHRLANDVVTITIDGGAPTTWNVPVVTGDYPQSWTSPALDPAQDHTIVVAGAAGSQTSFCGATFFNGDEAAGVSVIDGAHSGATMKIYAETYPNWVDHLKHITTKGMVVTCLTNDCRTSSSGYSSAQYKTYAQTIINMARAKVPNLPVLFMPPYRLSDSETLIEPWDNYLAKLHELADENTFCAVYDMSQRIPNLTTDTYGLRADGVHPSSAGYAYMAGLATSALTPK
jgi:lysophospholipase L1-like esterase